MSKGENTCRVKEYLFIFKIFKSILFVKFAFNTILY